jgi:hypothetical protein
MFTIVKKVPLNRQIKYFMRVYKMIGFYFDTRHFNRDLLSKIQDANPYVSHTYSPRVSRISIYMVKKGKNTLK